MSFTNKRRERFEEIFARHEWGGESHSGPGSDRFSTASYVDFINGWLRRHGDVRNIVEIGCGDWATSSLIDLLGKKYIGVDIVEPLIAQNLDRYGSSTRSFVHADFVEQQLPPGEVLIAKDVLQHLSDDLILQFISNNRSRFKYFIFTNDISKYIYKKIYRIFPTKKPMDSVNRNISDGESRPLRLDLPPFNLAVSERERYEVLISHKPKIVYTKEIIVCHNQLPASLQ